MPDPNPVNDRPLRVMFLITSMDVGGAETLLANMMRRFDPRRIVPQVACLKQAGELGEQMAASGFRVHSHLIRGKYDALVIRRLRRLMRSEKIDAVITVGAGDKMFWGRLAARHARVPVVLSALHSTGWPDGVGRMNRMLTPITDGFIAVASPHQRFLIEHERFPPEKVHLIPNGIDTDRFVADAAKRRQWRAQYSIPADSPVVGIVAALRPEKNHELFLRVADQVGGQIGQARFLIVGDGQQREYLEALSDSLDTRERIHFVGNSHDIPGLLSAMDLFVLTSHNEASPVSILEAMSVGLPVVAPDVGSIDQAVLDGETGFLVRAGDGQQMTRLWMRLLQDDTLRKQMGRQGRRHVVEYGSLQTMTDGYTDLVETLFTAACPDRRRGRSQSSQTTRPDRPGFLPATEHRVDKTGGLPNSG